MRKYIAFLFILFYACGSQNVTTKDTVSTPEGKDLIINEQLQNLKLKNEYGHFFSLKNGNELIINVNTFKKPEHVYDLALSIPIKKDDYSAGSVFLLSFDGITTKSSLETGEAKVRWILRQSDKYAHNITKTLTIASNEWKTYYIPIQLTRNVAEKNLKLVIHFGFSPQSFLMKNLKFISYPKGTRLEDLPRTKIKYQGMEPDAPWRKEAQNRIEKIRKTDFNITFYQNGKPVSDAPVHLELLKHEFLFGATLTARDVVGKWMSYRKLKKDFNMIVLMNDLKIRQWIQQPKRELTLQAMEIIKEDSLVLKGHVLLWPSFHYMPKKLHYLKNKPAELQRYIDSVQTDMLVKTKGYTQIWDIVNEAYTNTDFQKITGSEEIIYKSFRKAKMIQPSTKRFTNEYGIISNGGADQKKQEWYYNFIKRIDKNTNGLVDGIGIQSHIGTDLTSPERIYEILNYYGQLGKEIAISEFTLDIEDPDLRERYTRDFMTMAFSHPHVTQFNFWGLVNKNHSKVDIYNPDGSWGSMGKAYIDLTQKKWHTDIRQKTDNQGKITGRGFYGTYRYSIELNGKTLTGKLKLSKGKDTQIRIEL